MHREIKRIIIEMNPHEYKKIKSAAVWFDCTLRELVLKGIEAIAELDELRKGELNGKTIPKNIR